MANSYLGEIRMFGGNYAPQGWALCDGRTLKVQDHPELAALLGNRFENAGEGKFALPDLTGRVVLGSNEPSPLAPEVPQAPKHRIGQTGGSETVSLSIEQIPLHTHPVAASATRTTDKAAGSFWAPPSDTGGYAPTPDPKPLETTLHPKSIGETGGSDAHDNMMPYLPVSYIIALEGTDPWTTGKGPTPTLGQILLLPYDLPSGPQAPDGWVPCDGRSLQIAYNQALFAILGTTFGGDGKTTFKVPDLRGRVPIGTGKDMPLGKAGGEETHKLTVEELPAHRHPAYAGLVDDDPSVPSAERSWGGVKAGFAGTPSVRMSPQALSSTGGGGAHDNMQPYVALAYYLCVKGIFPMRA